MFSCAWGVTRTAGGNINNNRYNAKTKRLEREGGVGVGVGVGGGNGNGDREAAAALLDGSPETDYVVIASTRFDPKVDAASDSGLEIDQVGSA